MKKFILDPTKHGFEPISNYPELNYAFHINENTFIKIICYANYGGIVYWYLALSRNTGLGGDDRVSIVCNTHDFRKPSTYEAQCRNGLRNIYHGLISSDKFAKELFTHLLGTTDVYSVKKEGIERYNERLGNILRKAIRKNEK